MTARARTLLAAAEREAAARRHGPASSAVRVDHALLAALELGVAGLPRDAVGDRLRTEFAVTDADGLLDAVFGPGTTPHARLPRTVQPSG